MLKILHIIDTLSSAGPTRSLIAAAKYATQQGLEQQHRAIALQSNAYPLALILAKQAGIVVLRQPSREILHQEIAQADLVQLHFWNNPQLYELLRSELPPLRLLVWLMVMGDRPPQIVTPALVEYADFTLATSPCTLNLPIFDTLSPSQRRKIDVVYGIADWDRLANFQARSHPTFNVGYIGTVNFAKMHPNYIPMSAAIAIPDVRFIVCGGGNQSILQQQALDLGSAEKFEFRGYVENIKTVLETLDVFGYPLCADTYATSEKSLQEAMYAGVPPVVFAYGGVKDLVDHQHTGLIVATETEYRQAIEYLYHHPDVRIELGQNAAEYARKVFDGHHATQKLHQIYQRMMESPKRQRTWKDSISLTQPTPAELFVQTLGTSAPQFYLSMTAVDDKVLLAADTKISESSALLTGGEGGIVQYRNFYPNDGYLRLWSGLVLQHQCKHATAAIEFAAAIERGVDRWHIYWYLAQSAVQIQDDDTAQTALSHVIATAPNFIEAQALFHHCQPIEK